ncbi:hypothetical protein A5692_18500 [Mycobacterium sp. E342]|uniref:hypothetical protein n=1 Tax=unclassified Mycobacterium TaxID=2642494 RepID=UPI0007FE5ACD|nr:MULTISPECIES: hypothetical protein [unclassified Mycobacterium]OBH06969.1 hypothetical protein A9X04_24385 [Mycobacterium sp. E3247]OBH30811.1 hypothetical protein A5692_18500 [Mycobacterium sp. E342]
MSRLRILGSAAVLAGVAAVSPVARADAPAPGDACTVLHATAQDANNRTMWCNPTMTGAHDLVWQYGGPGYAAQGFSVR